MGSEKKKEKSLLPFMHAAPHFIQEEFGSIIKIAGIDDLYETLIVPRVVDEDLGYHFMMSHFLSRDKRYCATAGTDGRIVLWNLKTKCADRIFKGHKGHATSVCMTPDNKKIISGGKDNTLRFWDRDTGKCQVVDRYMDHVYCLAISKDGTFVASGGRDNIVRLWHINSRRLVKSYKGHTSCVLSLCFSPDGNKLLSGGADGQCFEWTLFSDANRLLYAGIHIIDALAMSPDDCFVLLGGRMNSLFLIHRGNGCILKELKTEKMTVFDITFSSDSCFAAICGKPRYLKVYEIPSGKCIKTISVCNEHIHKINFYKNTHSLITSGGDTTLRVWNLNTEKADTITRSDTHVIRSVAMNTSYKFLAAGRGNGEIKVWDMTTCRMIYELQDHSGLIRASVFHSKKPYLYTASWDGTIKAWDMTNGKLSKTYYGPGERIYSICFSNDDDTIFAADHNGNIIHLSEELSPFNEYYTASEYCYTVSVNKNYITAGSGKKIDVWNRITGTKKILIGHTDDIYSLALHPQKPLLLSASMDSTLRLWDLEQGSSLVEYRGHKGRVTYVTVNNSFSFAYSLGTDSCLRKWNILSGECEGVYYWHSSPVHAGILVEEKKLFISGGDDGILCFWDISRNSHYKGNNAVPLPIAILSVYPEYYLWLSEPGNENREGWFYTEIPQRFDVVKKNKEGTIVEKLHPGDLDRETFLRVYNRPDILAAQIMNREKYNKILYQLSRKNKGDSIYNIRTKQITENRKPHVP